MTKNAQSIVKNVAPVNLELLLVVVKSNRAGYFANLIQGSEANIQLITQASGTSEKAIMDYLGLKQSNRSAVMSIVREDKIKDLMEILNEKFGSIKDGGGIAVTVPLSSMVGLMAYGFLSNDKRTITNE